MPTRNVAKHSAASRFTGPPMNIVLGLVASLAHCGNTLYTAVSLGRVRSGLVQSSSASPGDDLSKMLTVCGTDRRTYRGMLTLVNSGGAARTVNTAYLHDYLLGVVFAGRENLPMTAQLNLLVSAELGAHEYNVDMAATLQTALVPLLIYFLSGKWFARGIAAGAVKG